MLEEIGYEYKITKIDLDKGEQLNSDFKKTTPTKNKSIVNVVFLCVLI